jgi:hypothetical protein
MALTELEVKPGRDPERRQHQAQVKNAIVEGNTLALVNLLARLRVRRPYKNYTAPEDFQEFAFSVKGLVRLEMMNIPAYKGWRRLFGANTKAKDISTWRSRVMVHAFPSLEAARAYIEADPLLNWPGAKSPELPERLEGGEPWLVLFQVHDVWLKEAGRFFADLLRQYLVEDSRAFQLVSLWQLVAPAGGGR